ncbi:MAG: glycosyltransferase family 2 protein [Gemmatimonadales bacterium]
MPRASIVIPTWNGSAVLRECLRTLAAQTFTDFEVVVVDNGSTDGTAEMLAAEFPRTRLIPLGSNKGFAAATNAGLQAAGGEILVCLNNDVEAEPDWLAAMVRVLDERPEIGFVACKMLNAHRPELIDAAGDAMSLLPWNIGRGQKDGPAFDQPRELLSACAGAAAYRRALFDRIGWFDEGFFAFFEDVDIGIRAQLTGFRCWYEPRAVVRHRFSTTASRAPDFKIFLLVRNGLKLFFQTMPLRRVLGWGPVVLLWPWLDPIFYGRPLRVTARAWFAFWLKLPEVLRARRRIYRMRTVPVSRLFSVLESPWGDMRRAALALPRRLGMLVKGGQA